MRARPWIWLLTLIAANAAAQSPAAPAQPPAASAQYDVAPTPAWVRTATPLAPQAGAEKAYGMEFLLLDRQTRADVNSTFYMRSVVHLLSTQGVTDYSQISLGFDPQTERLTLHGVTLRRGSQSVDEL